MNQWKSAYAAKTKARTLAEALEGADAFFGLSVKGAVTQEMVQVDGARSRSSSPWPTPIPRSRPRTSHAVRDDAIMATGRSDYPNQINNVLGFPFIFRGALDVQASTINEAMKIAAANALAELARAEVPDQVAAAFHGRRPTFGPELHHSGAVRSAPDHARAAGRRQGGDGFRRRPPADRRHGCLRRRGSTGRLDPVAGWLQSTFEQGARRRPSASSSPRARSRRSSAPPTPISARASASRSWSARPTTVTRASSELGMRPAARVRDRSTRATSPYAEEFTEYPLRAPAAAAAT